MATATATFLLQLDANVGAAGAAAGDLNLLKTAISSDIAELSALETAMKQVNKGGEVNVATFRAMQARAEELKESIATGQQEFVRLGGSFSAASKATEGMALSTGKLDETTKKALGPMGEKIERLGALKAVLGTSGLAAVGFVAAIALVAVGVVIAAAAIGKLVYEMMQFALTTSDAANKSQIMLEGLTGSSVAAGELESSISRVASKSTKSTAEITKLAEGLYKSGKRGSELEKALLEATYAADGLGKNPSPELLKRRMANLDVQALKFKDHIAAIFSGQSTRTAIEKFEMGLESVLDLFDTNTSSGKALQSIVSSMLDPLFNAVTAIAPYAKAMFKGMVVGALLLRIVVLALSNEFKAMFGDFDMGIGKMDGMQIAFYAGIVVVGLLVVALGVLAVAAAVVGVVLLAVLASIGLFLIMFVVLPIALVVAAVVLFVGAMYAIGVAVSMAIESLIELGAAGIDAAGSLIDGLVNGITSGAGAVFDAIKGLASGALSTLMSALDAHSPSKKFLAVGKIGIAGGVEEGVDAGAEGVNAAVDSLVSIPSTRGGAGEVPELAAGGAKGASGGRPKISLGPINVMVQDAGQGGAVAQFYEQLCEKLEEAGAAAGIDFEFEGAPA